MFGLISGQWLPVDCSSPAAVWISTEGSGVLEIRIKICVGWQVTSFPYLQHVYLGLYLLQNKRIPLGSNKCQCCVTVQSPVPTLFEFRIFSWRDLLLSSGWGRECFASGKGESMVGSIYKGICKLLPASFGLSLLSFPGFFLVLDLAFLFGPFCLSSHPTPGSAE